MSDSGANLEPWLREILRCPACQSELVDEIQEGAITGFQCTNESCARTYPVVDGIPVLLIDQAR